MIRKDFANYTTGDVTKASVAVTFTLPASIWADQIYLVGEWNNWNRTSHPFDRTRDGEWTLTIGLETGRSYQFRYLLDEHDWLNDTEADGYVYNPYDATNFIVVTDIPPDS